MNWKKIFGLFIGLIVLGFLIKILLNSWNNLGDYDFKINYLFILVSFLFLSISPFLVALSWQIMFKGFKEKISYLKIFNILTISMLIRYIPGNIWFIAGRAQMFKKYGISRLKTTITIFIELGILLLAACFIFLIAVILGYNPINFPLYWLALIVGLILISLHPKIFSFFVKKGFKIIQKKDVDLNWNSKTNFQVFSLLSLHWIFQGFAFYFLINSFYPFDIVHLIPLIGVHAIAWVLSFLTFISPAGLGVKEGILVLFLQFLVPLDIAIIASILLRILTVGHEMTFALISTRLRRLE
jgi:glycosyltransferase 2 family protein